MKTETGTLSGHEHKYGDATVSMFMTTRLREGERRVAGVSVHPLTNHCP